MMTAPEVPPNHPPVSVVLPAYNGAETIEGTLRSLVAQDYRPLELVVVDDGSTEPVAPLVQNVLGPCDLPVRVIRHATNQGLSRTLNDGWRSATGELILIVHQDIELLGANWVQMAVAILLEQRDVQIVTCHYGIPATGELNFASRAFGFLRQQVHEAPLERRETATFTEFKCDLVRKQALENAGGFSTKFRLAGEDIFLSYRIRQQGGRILKAYDLHVLQRFAGTAASIRGNLWKEYRFGMAFAGVLITFRGYAFRDLSESPYSRSRSWHRASQPIVAAAELALLFLTILTSSAWLAAGLLAVLVTRFLAYSVRMWPDFKRTLGNTSRAVAETLGAAALGLITDAAYSAGLFVGLVRAGIGAPL